MRRILIMLCLVALSVTGWQLSKQVENHYSETKRINPTLVREQAIERQETQQPEKVEVLEKEPVKTSGQQMVSLGMFTSFAYCKENYPHICNNGNATSTATGTTPTVGRTIAVDPSVIPLGSQVIINGHTYTAEDTGGAIKGRRIDILHATHQEALQYGIRQVEVFIMK